MQSWNCINKLRGFQKAITPEKPVYQISTAAGGVTLDTFIKEGKMRMHDGQSIMIFNWLPLLSLRRQRSRLVVKENTKQKTRK
jgi:hypothetical protein